MFSGFKAWIETGVFDLNTITARLDTAFARGKLTDEQYEQLLALARDRAKPEQSYAPWQEQIDRAFERIEALTARVEALEGTGGESGGPADEWPAWRQPTGAHDAYYAGAAMTYTDGKRYTCAAPAGVACVWGPDVMPGYWREAQ